MTEKKNWSLRRRVAAIAVLCAGQMILALSASEARAPAMVDPVDGKNVLEINVASPPPQLVIAVDKSQLVRFDRPFRQISVGSRDIADVIPLSHTLIYILGKKLGTTNLTVQDADGKVSNVLDVSVSFDIEGLKQQLHDLMPDENITIHAAGAALVLSGQVSSTDHLRQVVAVADRFAPNSVTNLLTVGGSQQVLLEVHFDEVQRSALKDIGVNSNWALTVNNNTVISTITGAGIPASAFGTATAALTEPNYSFSATLNALETKGLVRELAEPNLVALSGDTASFLAGGEFPIPVVQTISGGAPTETIEFKEFGVALSFTPTVLSNQLLDLMINSEVSALDPTVSVTTNGIQVPGLKVRRAKTTIELNDGQSFAIAGLLQDDFKDSVNQIPGLGNIPVLGALLRSMNYQHNQTELVVFITVHLVQPGSRKAIVTPTQLTPAPTEGEMLMSGQTEGTLPDLPDEHPAVPALATNVPATDSQAATNAPAATAPVTDPPPATYAPVTGAPAATGAPATDPPPAASAPAATAPATDPPAAMNAPAATAPATDPPPAADAPAAAAPTQTDTGSKQ